MLSAVNMFLFVHGDLYMSIHISLFALRTRKKHLNVCLYLRCLWGLPEGTVVFPVNLLTQTSQTIKAELLHVQVFYHFR